MQKNVERRMDCKKIFYNCVFGYIIFTSEIDSANAWNLEYIIKYKITPEFLNRNHHPYNKFFHIFITFV